MHLPNNLVLEAQGRVCTGPHQSRPLGKKADDPQPEPVLEAILQTLQGQHPQPVSTAQMGAFFIAMNLRRNFPEATNWSQAETQAFAQYNTSLQKHLTPDLAFILGLESDCAAETEQEKIVIDALKIIMTEQHLSYAQTRQMCEVILTPQVRDSLKGAVLIGQRMNRETDDEVRGYLDSAFSPDSVYSVNATNLTHFGQPYNGSTRYFKPTLFVAAIRAALGRPSVLHGVDTLPPKWGVTEEQMLTALNCRTNLSLQEVAQNLENPNIGFAYISQREYAPQAYSIRDIRAHIGKRPPWSATEKAQQIFSCTGTNHIVIGYYHAGYERPLLNLVWARNFQSALAIKGEEGTSHFSLRLGKPSDEERKAINYAQGFHRLNNQRQDFACDVDPAQYGLEHDPNPRPEAVDPQTFVQLGIAALSGEKGHFYDRLILNTALTDHLLGFTADPHQAITETQKAIDSGRAYAHLQNYITQNAK
jgi:anthranilate phosphoribosyltransferase